MTPDEMREIILSFRGAEEGVSYGAPAYKVNGKFFTRLRREDQSVVLTGISMDEREMLMEAEPTTLRELAAWPLAASVKLAESLAWRATLSAVELSSLRAVTT